MKIIAISNAHGLHWPLNNPDEDVLVHEGDLTYHSTLEEVRDIKTLLVTLLHLD